MVRGKDPALDRIITFKPFFLALGSHARLRIVAELALHGETAVSDLARALKMSQPLVSWHLARLRQGGVNRQRQEGRLAYCSVDVDYIRDCERMLAEMVTDPDSRDAEEGQSA